jgi:hypothetical protein
MLKVEGLSLEKKKELYVQFHIFIKKIKKNFNPNFYLTQPTKLILELRWAEG